jgi:hypothetical protein
VSRRFPALPAALAAVVVLVCLGTSGFLLLRLAFRESPQERFAARATEICDASKHTIDVAFRAQLAGEPTPEQIAAFLSDVLVPELRSRIDALERLEPPTGDAAELRDLYGDYREVIDAVDADPAAFVTRGDPFAEVDRRFDDLELPACGSAPPPD